MPYVTSMDDSRLNVLTGTAHPAPPTNTYLALYIGASPASDGTGGTEATGTRPLIAFGSPTTDPALNRRYVANTGAITTTLTNTSGGVVVGFAIFSASTGGTPIYVGQLPPNKVTATQSVTIPIGAIRVFSA